MHVLPKSEELEVKKKMFFSNFGLAVGFFFIVIIFLLIGFALLGLICFPFKNVPSLSPNLLFLFISHNCEGAPMPMKSIPFLFGFFTYVLQWQSAPNFLPDFQSQKNVPSIFFQQCVCVHARAHAHACACVFDPGSSLCTALFKAEFSHYFSF